MPLTDRDPNASGRTSRASNMSAGSRGLQKAHVPIGGRADLQHLSSAGVMSMLRTSTEVGDIGGLTSYDSMHMANVPRAPPRRSGASSRMSTASSQSNTSKRASSNHGAWPPSSSGPPRPRGRESNVPQYIPDTLSPTIMNIPGSSPLFPRSRSRNSRDGHRSLSMTYTSQPTFRLSSNRSFASLRTHEHVQRPRSPYHYPTRLRRPGYRPASPALSDITGTHPRRFNGNPGHHGPRGHSRARTPSDVSAHRSERGHVMQGHPGRSLSPTYLTSPYPDMPPLLPMHHHIVVEQARMAHRPAKGSVSSGSTNHRTDSDAPSSDATSPPTPPASMEVLISPTGTQVMMSNVSGVMRDEITTGPLFYDYSEQFDREQFMEPEADAVPTGFVHRIKTILEERGTPDQLPKKVDASVVQEVDEHTREVIVVAELPASPVPRRITRELILAALEPASTTDGVEMSESSSEGKKAGVPFCQENEEHVRSGQRQEEPANSMQLEEKKKHRSGVLSQAKSSVMDSSTQDLAVRYSVPMATASGNEPAVGSSTEDGMSDLLDGYQHTEMKQDHYAVAETESSMGEPNERHSSHTQRSSSQQSFKSCTDLPKKAYKDSDAKSAKSCTDLPELLEQPRKDSDGRSFKTCKDTVTPERAVSMPPLGVPSSGLASVETIIRRPVSEMPTSSTPLMVQKQPPIFPRESNFSMTSVKLRSGDSKPSVRHGSTVTSISSSVDSVIQKPPSVPPRDSSSSKEAQRTQAVADFLVRLSRPRRFSKAQSGFGKKQAKEQAKEEATAELESSEDVQKLDPPKDPQNAATGKPSTQLPSDLIRTSEKALPREKIISKKQVPTRLSSKHCASTKDSTSAQKLDSPITPLMHQHSLSTPSPVIAEPSSVYSPDDVASPRSRVQSSPMPFVKSPENGRRYSQTTTHLVWHGRNTSNLPSVNTAESRPTQGNGQDETTTDLRLSAYRYPLHYLPDLKEESHEDSSLNTSASNLKNSNFRFPFGRQPSLRASVDETAMLGRNPSTRSFHRKSSQLGHTRGLPSMNFSRMDLIGKLNEALDIHSSGLLGGMPDDVDFQELTQSGLLRPASAREIREKYRSFFASLDELEKTGDPTQAATTIMDLMPLKRPYSSEKLMEEIDKLTIPSVGGLTQRLSEFIPSLKEYYKLGEVGEFIAEQVIMEHAMEELNEVGGPAPKRSSARLRPMPGSPNMVVIDDTLYKELTDKDLKDIPRAGDDSADETEEDASDCGVVQRRGGYDTRARDRTPLAELEAPSPAFLRTRSHSLGHHDLRPSLEFRLSSRRSLRSFVTSTPTDTRPWNNIENYAFLATSVDISLPTPAGNMKFGQAPSPLRNQVARRDSAEYHGEEGPASLHNTTNNSPGSPSILANVSSLDDQIQPARRLSRFGMFSSSKHECFDASGNATGPLRLRGSDQSHAAGEDMSVDTGSEASEGEGHGTTVKKDRFTLRKGTGRKKATQAGHYTGSAPEYMQDREGEARDFSLARRNTFAGAERMPKRKYCVDRFINRIKIMWHKSGDFVRSLSKRNSNGNGNGNGAVQSQDEELSPFPKNVEENFVINKNGKKIYIPKGLEGSRGTEVYTGV